MNANATCHLLDHIVVYYYLVPVNGQSCWRCHLSLIHLPPPAPSTPLPLLPQPSIHQTQPWPTDRQQAQTPMYSICKFFFSFFFFLLTILISFLDYNYLVTMGPTPLSHPILPLQAPARRVDHDEPGG
ncbi:hypothetical protein L208DRAFT_40426 [Tricholoma matsutake]|nr:hypothetical protein L208DRAFT_40426 [Tricholoma matsutake 945]